MIGHPRSGRPGRIDICAGRTRCAVSGALLRYAVKTALNRDTFPLEKNPDGKPFIPNAPDFYFNLSHSG